MRLGKMRKYLKGITSLSPVLSVMVSLAVPFDISVFANEEPARG